MANASVDRERSSASQSPSLPDVTVTNGGLIELAFRLGVPTFVLVASMFLILPRLDRGLDTAQRVEVYLDVLAQNCMAAPSR